MLGGMDGGTVECLLRDALEAAALDLAEVARSSGAVGRVFLLADRSPRQPVPEGVLVEVDGDVTAGPFHFGERVASWVSRHGVRSMAVIGAGSGPLLVEDDWIAVRTALDGGTAPGRGAACCVTNNRFSADLVALAPASRLAALDPLPLTDNAIPRRLHDEHGVEVMELPRTLATQFNLDTPADLAALRVCGRGGPRLRALLAGAAIASDRMERAAERFTDRTAQVFIAGRVASRTWAYLETEAACRIRLLSEERGMQAAGTDADGTARSILAALIAEAGPERVFHDLLPQWCDAAFIDIRPTLVHLGIRPSRADRFAADLGDPALIEDERLRAIVAAASASPVPVVLGGHSLVGGVVQLLNQWAWDARDARGGAERTP